MDLIDRDLYRRKLENAICRNLRIGRPNPIVLMALQYAIATLDSEPVVDAIPISFIQQEIDGYYKDEAVTVPGTIINWVIRSKRLGLQYMIERWKKGQEKQNEKAEI